MLYRPFGKTGWNVSAIGMGTWNIGNQWGAVDDATAVDGVEPGAVSLPGRRWQEWAGGGWAEGGTGRLVL